MLSRIFEMNGHIETFCKCFAYSNIISTDKLRNIYHKIFLKKGELVQENPELMNEIFDYISKLGIKKGDILIVHSSMDGMRKAAPDANKIIDFLLELVGEDGTLVFPAFPIINRNYTEGKVSTYNPKRTLCWTGLLPNTFLTYENVKRSSFPFNSLAARGKYADQMIEHNLEANRPHGDNSAWKYCVDHHAKILYLGVNIAECNTVMHVAEDTLGDEWPIKDWYQKEIYRIKLDKNVIEKIIYVCSPQWAKYTACYHHTAIMKKKGLASENEIDGIVIGYTPDSKEMVDFVINEAKKKKIRYNIPKRYWK